MLQTIILDVLIAVLTTVTIVGIIVLLVGGKQVPDTLYAFASAGIGALIRAAGGVVPTMMARLSLLSAREAPELH